MKKSNNVHTMINELRGRKSDKVQDIDSYLGEGEKPRGMRLMPYLLMLVTFPLIVLSVVAVFNIRSVCLDVAESMVFHELTAAQYAFEASVNNLSTGNYMYTNNKFYKGKKCISDNHQIFDEFKQNMDLDVSVFYGDERVATSIKDENGNRIIGTKADTQIYDTVVTYGMDYFSDDIAIGDMKYYALYAPLYQNGNDEIIGITAVSLEKSKVTDIYMQKMAGCIAKILFIVVLAAIAAVISVLLLIKNMTFVTLNLKEVAKGNLTISPDKKMLTRVDEIGDIARSVDTLISGFKGIVTNIKEASGKMNDISGGFSESFGQMENNINSIGSLVDEVAVSSTNQAENTGDVTRELRQMGDALENTTGNVEQLAGNADKMREYNRNVSSTLEELIKISHETKQAFDVVYEQTNVTNSSAQDIQSAADVITDIAEQTNLLSLNASIEAARAGEHGKGFAVVADEIRKLAEQSAESASQITGIIDVLINNSNKTVETMHKVTQVIEKQGNELEQTKNVFGSLNGEIGEVGNAVDCIKDEMEVITMLKEQVLSEIIKLSNIAQNNAASTQETTAAMQELVNIVNNCRDELGQILAVAEELGESTGRFELS